MRHSLTTHAGLAFAFLGATAIGGLLPRAAAQPEEDDVSTRVRKQMEKIIELMRKNEQALLELSTGSATRPEGVQVEPPVPPEGDGSSSGASAGAQAERELEEIVREQRAGAERIPDELEELVRMVPE